MTPVAHVEDTNRHFENLHLSRETRLAHGRGCALNRLLKSAWALILAFLPALLILPQEAQAADCPAAAEMLKAALAKKDDDAARQSYDTIWNAEDCSGAFRQQAGRLVANLHVRVAQDRIDAGQTTLIAQQKFLEQALTYARTWYLLAMLGDIAAQLRDRDTAAKYYEEALVAIDDPILTPQQPSYAEVMDIFRLAEANNLLASQHRSPTRTRSGDFGGLAASNVRGIVIKKVAVPITFHTNTYRFTERGLRAITDMAQVLNAQKPPRITIAGHADSRGPATYNLDLSRDRAEAVKRYLLENGFTGVIEVRAYGETSPFPRDTLESLTQEELWQLDRRVELIR